METARGRWFLAEYARRNRAADTAAVLEALARLEAKLAATGRQPAAAAVPSVDPPAPVPRAAPVPEPAPESPVVPPRIPEPDFSAVEQLFARKPKPAAELDDEPWPPEADDPPGAIVAASSREESEEDPEVGEDDIEAWEAELGDVEQPARGGDEEPPAAALEPEQPREFSFFRSTASRDESVDEAPAVVEPPRRLASAAEWPAARAIEARSALLKPEIARPIPAIAGGIPAQRADTARMPPLATAPARPIGPSPAENPPAQRPAASLVERAQTVRPAASLLNQPEPRRPASIAPAAPARMERPAPRQLPRVDDPTITMTRDEKLAMFS